MELQEAECEIQKIIYQKVQLLSQIQLILNQRENRKRNACDLQYQNVLKEIWDQQTKKSDINGEGVKILQQSLSVLKKQQKAMNQKKDKLSRESQQLSLKLKDLKNQLIQIQTPFLQNKGKQRKYNQRKLEHEDNEKEKERKLQMLKQQLQQKQQQNRQMSQEVQAFPSKIIEQQHMVKIHYEKYKELLDRSDKLKVQKKKRQRQLKEIQEELDEEKFVKKKLVKELYYLIENKECREWELQIQKNQEIYQYLQESLRQCIHLEQNNIQQMSRVKNKTQF